MLIIFLFLSFLTQLTCMNVIINTSHGILKGMPSTLAESVVEFLGVPYALPPVNELRFKKPKPLPNNYYGKGLRVNRYSKACIQEPNKIMFEGLSNWHPENYQMSEDCLQLNMWVPEKKTGAVIVFLFGGRYDHGSASIDYYNGNFLAEKTGAIVVNLNYRLGVFGFAYFEANEPDGIPGNLGLLDQQLGLEWIHQNIRSFGGDPNKVTLFGQGSGAAMATAHLFASGSSHLFKRIIASSGTIHHTWATSRSHFIRENFKELIEKVRCDRGNYKDQIRCMQNVGALELVVKASLIKNPHQHYSQAAFTPIDKDDIFFYGNVTSFYRRREFSKNKVDLMIGKTEDEASLFMGLMLGSPLFNCKIDFNQPMISNLNQCNMTENNYNNVVNLISHTEKLTKKGVSAIKKIYKKYKSYRERALRAISDFGFNCDSNDFANVIDKKSMGNVYYYKFKKRSSSNPWPTWMGAMHRYDLLYIFGYPFTNPYYYNVKDLQNEQKYSEKIMNLIGGFVNYGNIKREIDSLEQTFKKNKKYKDKFEIRKFSSRKFDKSGFCSDVEFIRKKYRLSNYP